MGKIGGILSDKESMKQLGELAEMLMEDTTAEGEEPSGGNEKCGDEASGGEGGEDSSEKGGFDFGMLLKLQEIMGCFTQSDKNSELLMALRPHLREERQEKVDKAVKLLKVLALFSILRENGILEDFL